MMSNQSSKERFSYSIRQNVMTAFEREKKQFRNSEYRFEANIIEDDDPVCQIDIYHNDPQPGNEKPSGSLHFQADLTQEKISVTIMTGKTGIHEFERRHSEREELGVHKYGQLTQENARSYISTLIEEVLD